MLGEAGEMAGNSDSFDVGIQRGGRTLVLVAGLQVEGVDMTHATFHIEIDKLLCGIGQRGWGTFFSGGAKTVIGRHTEKTAGCKFKETSSVEIGFVHCMKIN